MPAKNGPSAAFVAQAGKGRPKGVKNKLTMQVKEMILAALDGAGGVEYLAQQAEENPTAFMTLVGKVLPLQLTGEGGGPIQTQDVSCRDAPDEVLRWLASQRAGDQSAYN